MNIGGFFMNKISKITVRVIPLLSSILLIRLIIIYGNDLWYWIDEMTQSQLFIVLDDWELDHAAFGFSLGLPMAMITVYLSILRFFSLTRLIIFSITFYLLQCVALVLLSYLSVEFTSLPYSDFTYTTIPDIWFWNSALITASVIAYAVVFIVLFMIKYSDRNTDVKTIDS